MTDQIKQLLSILQLKQQEFAKSVHLSTSHVSDVVTGRRKGFSTDVLLKITEIYNVNLHWLLTGEGEMFLEDHGTMRCAEPSEQYEKTTSKNGLHTINGSVREYPDITGIEQIARTAWWRSLTETEREIIVFSTELRAAEMKKKGRDFFAKNLSAEKASRELDEAIDSQTGDGNLRQKGDVG